MTTGTMLLMWLGEQITERGIGNGISLDHHHRHCVAAAAGGRDFSRHVFSGGGVGDYHIMGTGIMMLLLGGGHRGRHRGHAGAAENSRAIRPARRGAQNVFGRHVVHAAAVNYAGVMPIIFAQSILMFPQPIFTKLADLASKTPFFG
jgi:preprotein translocase subunit SecY